VGGAGEGGEGGGAVFVRDASRRDPRKQLRPLGVFRIERDGAAARGYLSISREAGEYHTETLAEPEGWAEHEAARQPMWAVTAVTTAIGGGEAGEARAAAGETAAGAVAVEVPFAVRIPAGEACAGLAPSAVPTVLLGVIDLVWRAGDAWRILDYKTDLAAARGESLLPRHAAQFALYRAAFERATGIGVARIGVVALRTGKVEWAE
jgi:hypothetical protein